MNFEEKQMMYAKLLVHHGLNVQKGQDVYISSEVVHKDFVTKIVQAAYQRGARLVSVDLQDPRNVRTRILETKNPEHLSFVAPFIPYRFESMIPETAASLRLIGPEYPGILSDLDPKKVQQVEINYRKALKKYYEEGVGHSKVQWLVAASATPLWAKRIFKELNEKEAYEALWESIFTICRADKEDCLELWKKHNDHLATRAKKLTDLQIKTLHFKGPGTDLKIGLSARAKFKGGASYTPNNVGFEPNIPTEECFTTPDYRMTEGHVQTTRPFLINGKLIEGLTLTFKHGEIVDFTAKQGRETFKEYISSDEGAKRLGEVALVGIDSPIYQSGRVFEEILFDENAACHIAIGFAYRNCIKESTKMSDKELDEIGCNISNVHTDMMISSENIDVEAECYSGKKISLIKKGAFTEF